jgi:hypothetical protein
MTMRQRWFELWSEAQAFVYELGLRGIASYARRDSSNPRQVMYVVTWWE